jgi:hypothetical protein
MARDTFSLPFEQICITCYLPDCCEFSNRGGKRDVCPLRITKRLGLTANQGKALSDIARLRQYRPALFLRMAERQAEWNQIVVGGL